MIFAQQNERTIGAPDKLFGVSSLAKERIAQIGKENVINSTIGVLLDEQGKLVVLESVMEAVRGLTREDYAAMHLFWGCQNTWKPSRRQFS